MKTIVDPALKISISAKKASYNLKTDIISPSDSPAAGHCRSGYLVSDGGNRCVGIILGSERGRTARLGNCEILFFKEYRREFGSRRIVKMHGERFPFATLEKILAAKGSHTLVIDERTRTVSK